MGSTFDHQEIISTPEAKGMRTLPSARGIIVKPSNLVARRGVGMKALRSVPIGRAQNNDAYTDLKAASVDSPDAARALQLLQVDTTKPGASTTHQSLRLQTEFAGLDDTEIKRPDCQIAAGPRHLVTTVNAAMAVFDKSGRELMRRNFTDIFTPLIGDAVIFSPRVVYDQFRDGWVVASCAKSQEGNQSWFLLAFSQGGDPLGDWWIWALDARYDGGNKTGHWADGLGLSIDNTSLYLTANMFNGQGNFVYSKLRLLNKKEMQIGGILHGWDFWQLRNHDGSPAFGLQPAVNLRAAGAQYMLNSTQDGQGLTQWTLSQTPRQTPMLSRKFIPTVAYQLAPNAKGQTAGRLIETGDTRLGTVVFRHGLLWVAHTIAANWGDDENVSAIQWLQINPRAGCITQQGIFGAPHFYYYAPAVMADGEGDMIMVFNRVGELDSPEIRFTGRCASDEQNTLQESAVLQQSLADGGTEWSAFSGASSAPEESSIWIIGQYAATNHDWATWIGSVTYAEGEISSEPIENQRIFAQ